MKNLILNYENPGRDQVIENLRKLDFVPNLETPDWLLDVAAFIAGMSPLLQKLSSETELPAFLSVFIKSAKEHPGNLYVFTGAAIQLNKIVLEKQQEEVEENYHKL